MKVRAAIAREAGRPLGLETVDVEGPRADEVLIEIKAAGICIPANTRFRSRSRRHLPGDARP
jgi:Zn-dependent alcohol dehydrogenase